MQPLREIFNNLPKPCDKWSPYFFVYERHLIQFVNKKPRVMEIGVQRGGSIDMWLQWFGAGTHVTGVDIDPECAKLSYDGDVDIVIGDQGSVDFWNQTLANRPKYDVIIDDGGHTMRQQIVSLECLWNHLNEGGVYICEDTHTSYWQRWGGSINYVNTFQNYCKRLTDYINREHVDKGLINRGLVDIYQNNLASVHFYNSQVVLEKWQQPPFERVISG